MKKLIPVFLTLLAPLVFAADAPKALSALPKDSLIKGAITVVVPPEELDKYVAKVEEAARKDPEWFEVHMKKTAPGVPIEWDEKVGLTKEEYEEYLALWEKREFRAMEPVVLQLKEGEDGKWSITSTGGGNPISTLKYDAEADAFVSPNGTMKRLEDVKADKHSILGEWNGHEWKFDEETTLGKTKENFALGTTADGKFGLIVYRMQEITTAGTRVYDKSLVIRFPMGEAGILKPEEVK